MSFPLIYTPYENSEWQDLGKVNFNRKVFQRFLFIFVFCFFFFVKFHIQRYNIS